MVLLLPHIVVQQWIFGKFDPRIIIEHSYWSIIVFGEFYQLSDFFSKAENKLPKCDF
jgi:hypothetical protein